MSAASCAKLIRLPVSVVSRNAIRAFSIQTMNFACAANCSRLFTKAAFREHIKEGPKTKTVSALPATQPITVHKLTPAIGAVIGGIDLAQPQTPDTIAAIQKALITNHVIFFHNQKLTPATQRDFASHFGTLHVHPVYPHVREVPEIVILDNILHKDPGSDQWHTDATFLQKPPLGSILAAKMLPPVGGDTLWSSNIAAYRALSPSFQALLKHLTALHDFSRGFTRERFGTDNEKYNEAAKKNPPLIHPVVRVHPVTGEEGLFVNSIFTSRIVELGKAESDSVLQMLFAHMAKPEFTVRWRWSLGDVAFWDNRSTQHYAAADYLPQRRVMHRATVLGDYPRGPASSK